MNAWKKNGYYGGVAVYVGGKNRGCAQPNLTRSWVKSVDTMGWRVIPLYVGAQPPCQKSRNNERFTAATAVSVGASNAGDAVAKASALGMRPGSPSYLNMESYGFSSSSAAAIATAKDRTDLPGNLWYALWNGRETTTKDWPWDPRLYTGHSRGHQYKANSRETRRGHTLTVDLNAWDAPVALVG